VKAAGFSLIEVLVATAVVAVGVASLAQLIVLSARANRVATTTSVTLLLAEQKMEELLVNPAEPSNQGHVDYLGPGGMSLGVEGGSLPPGAPPPQGTAYVCQWSTASLSDGPGAAILVQVLVAPWPDGPGQSRLVSVKTRKAS
jgi:prepilin-type N-terminal cleavage/methylation domain-containing protein